MKKLINLFMHDGKKTRSSLLLTLTLNRLANHGDVIALIQEAIDNVKPIVECRKVRISGTTQLVPSIISAQRQKSLAIRWIREAAIKRTKKTLSLDQCLYAEILDAANKSGAARKRRDDLHKLAEANRGFSHYRWW